MSAAPQTVPTPTGPTVPRASYLGASDIAAVIGLNPYRTALDVWAEKVRGVPGRDSDAANVGRKLERPVLEALYAEPRRLRLDYPGTILHGSEPWMGATPDALAGRAQLDRAAECKIVGRRQMQRWGAPEEGADGIPPEVLVQATWQLATVNSRGSAPLASADVVALLGTELRVYGVRYDAELAADLMEAGRAFWQRHVVAGEMPEVRYEGARDTLVRAFRQNVQGMLMMREDVRDLAREYMRAHRAEVLAKAAKDRAGNALCALIGEAAGFEEPGLKVTWLPRKGTVSYKAIVDALGVPESEREDYRGDPTRVLRVVGGEEDDE